ncbi:MAG: HDOD domain-containing protein [candidate division Zixibacteria bacterium]|nr:HDOD domain-containing protein [candidate division Zixibacteria bacterium]
MSLIGRHETLRRLDEFEVMPSIPQIIVRVREISEDPRSSVADLANIILSDHALTSRILKIANSAFYAEYANRVSTITQAITLMGFRTVQNVVISLAMFDAMDTFSRHKFDFRQFWTHSLATGVIGKMIAAAARYKVPEEAFIAGFMHNIGVAILAVVFPEEEALVLKKIERGEEQITAEKSIFGIDHGEVGGWLARKWNLPALLARPIMEHHRRGLPSRQRNSNCLVDYIYVADLAYDAIFKGDETRQRAYVKAGLDLVGITEEVLVKILEAAPELIRNIANELEISLKAPATTKMEVERDLVRKEAAETIQKLQERNRELAIIQEAGEALRCADSEDEIVQTTLEEVIRGVGIGRVLLLKIDAEAKSAQGALGFGVNSQQSVYDIALPLGDNVVGRTVADRAVQNIVDADSEIYQEVIGAEERAVIGCCAFATLPVVVGENVEFVMIVNNPDPTEPVDDERLRTIASLINQAAMAIERIRLRRVLEELQGTAVNQLLKTAVK